MPAQPSLPGFAPASPIDRLFLTIFPDPQNAARIAALAAEQCARHGLRGRPLPAERLHVTLFHLGDWIGLRSDMVQAARRAASQVVAAPFDVSLDQVATFGLKRSRVLLVLRANGGNAPLHTFRGELGVRLAAAGLGSWAGNGFEPHVTLAYGARQINVEPVTPISWRVERFSLVHSLLGHTRHIPLAQWQLA